MADSKISALPTSTTPLASTEVVPLVQSGITKNVSVANLTAGRAVNTAGGTFTDNQTQGTAAKGINFTANTPAAGMTSQLLNWYEEGTWTPAFKGSVSDPTVTTANLWNGTYTRIGRVVHCCATLQWTASSGGSGNLTISGLPFTSNSGTGRYATWNVGYNTGLTTPSSSILRVYQDPNSSVLNLISQIDSSATSNVLATSAIATSGTVYLIIEGFYFV